VSKGCQNANRQQKVKLFGNETVAEGVFLRILLHNNEPLSRALATTPPP
jgi:hypothetical protein